MGVEPDDDSTPEASPDDLAERLGTDDVVFVDALNREIGELVDTAPGLRFDYVVGDVSSANVASSGHLYFDLVHDGSTVTCVCFRSRLDRIDPEIEDGLQVAVRGDLSYYEDGGSLSVIVEDVVELGDGVYERTYRENRRRLEADGLLADEAKQPLPEYPRRIGIVTSAESDAREDAVRSIQGRHPDVEIEIHNASVQGEAAMSSLMAAIGALDDDARIDVIVVTRGGGADKHLRVFNETPLCRVIANADTPVVVGVGHENDRTLADEVADLRVMTPTHVGEVVPEKAALVEEAEALADRLEASYRRAVRARLDELDRALATAYEGVVSDGLATLRTDLDHAFETVATERLVALEGRLDAGLELVEQRAAHEAETAAVAASYEAARRRQRVAIAALAVLVLLLLAYIVLYP